MKKFLVILFLLTACDKPNLPTHEEEEKAMNGVEALRYFQDQRTSLCFVGWQMRNVSRVISYVPCTPEVLNIIATKKRLAESK